MELMQNSYIDAINIYESTIDPEYKKANGIFYTDFFLAEKMLLEIKINRSAFILDPCCGAGVFLYAAQKHGYSNIVGIDKDKNAVEFCNNNIPGFVVAEFDSINRSWDDVSRSVGMMQKADLIIGNPPYVPITKEISFNAEYLIKRRVLDSGKNLFIAAMMRAFEFLKTDGILSYIIPKNFLHVNSYSLFRRQIIKDKTIVSIVDIGSYFKNVRGEQIIITIKNKKPRANHKIKIKKYSSNRFVTLVSIPQSSYKDEILLFKCENDYSIYKKLTSSYQTMSDLCKGYVGRGKSNSLDAVTGKDIRKFGYKNKPVPIEGNKIFIQNIYSAEAGIIAAFGGNMNATQTVTVFTDGDSKMCRYILGILHTRLCNLFLYKYCYNYSKVTMHTDAKYLKKIPLPSLDNQKKHFDNILKLVEALEKDIYMTQNWFNSLEKLNFEVYKAYELTDSEAEYIDNEVKNFQSKRWLTNE